MFDPESLHIGQVVNRDMAGVIMQLVVTNITHNRVICGDYEFDFNGDEVDDYFPGIIMSRLT